MVSRQMQIEVLKCAVVAGLICDENRHDFTGTQAAITPAATRLIREQTPFVFRSKGFPEIIHVYE